MELPHLAATQMHQHGIPYAPADTILSLDQRHRHDGAHLHFLDKKSRARMARAMGSQTYSKLERSLNSCLAVSVDGTIIAAVHRLGRLKP